jgi:hypothetical protein
MQGKRGNLSREQKQLALRLHAKGWRLVDIAREIGCSAPASAHAWAHDTATDVSIEVIRPGGELIEATTRVAEPGPLIAMKLQAVMNRSAEKQGTDLLDIVRLTLDPQTRPVALAQIGQVAESIAADIALHVDLWFVRRRLDTIELMHAAGGRDVVLDHLDLVGELLRGAARRGLS